MKIILQNQKDLDWFENWTQRVSQVEGNLELWLHEDRYFELVHDDGSFPMTVYEMERVTQTVVRWRRIA